MVVYEGCVVNPSTLTPDELREAFAWEGEHPSEAFALKQRAAAERREEADRDALRSEWARKGGAPEEFDAAYRKLRADELRRMADGAREAGARRLWGTF